ncbi:MAG: prolyl oligopeptidase family serine peptidase [Myxococcota bacterium]
MLLASLAFAADLPAELPGEPTAAPAAGDPHQWLEDVYGEPALAWVDAHNARTLPLLRQDPRYEGLRAKALSILESDDRLPLGEIHAGYVWSFWRDAEHVRGIWRRSPLAAYRSGAPAWETLLDYDALAAQEGRNWVAEGATCLPPAYERCMVELSDGGRDAAVWREFDTRTRTFVEGGFSLPEAKASVAWVDVDTLLVATDWGPGTLTTSGYPRTVRAWPRGAALADLPVFAEGEPTDVAVRPRVIHGDDGPTVFVTRDTSFFETVFSVTDAVDHPLAALPFPKHADLYGVLDGRVVLGLREPWTHGSATYPNGAVVAYELATGVSEPVRIPTSHQSIEAVGVGSTGLVVQYLEDVSGRAARLERDRRGRWRAVELDVPGNGVVSLVSSGGGTDEVFLSFESLTTPPSLVSVNPRNRVRTMFGSPASYDAADVVVEQRFATSTDGTRVPYFVMARRDVLAAGDAPTVQYAYGGFLAATLPAYFSEAARPQFGAFAGAMWVERGGVLVLTNMRGGSEYGPAWHEAVLKDKRQLAFDDFFAVSRALIESGLTRPEKLGALGRSNGGLLMGVVQTQHPELYGAIVNGVPLYDMLRYTQLGAGASWIGEYGDPDVPAEREVLAAYSPYHQLAAGKGYPPVLFYTSTEDDRVHPGHARKAVAQMEALEYEVYLYENREGGHGGTANQAQLADLIALQYTFFSDQLGLR